MSKSDTRHSASLSGTRPSIGQRDVFPWWVLMVVILGSVLMCTGAVVALFHPGMLVSPRDKINGAVHIYAGYLASRNLGIALMLMAAMILRAKQALGSLMVLTASIQLLDAAIDCMDGRWAIVPGVLVLGLLFLIGSARLSGYPFWRTESWR
jgi:hypothetical protein